MFFSSVNYAVNSEILYVPNLYSVNMFYSEINSEQNINAKYELAIEFK